jgi:hypothetical protein
LFLVGPAVLLVLSASVSILTSGLTSGWVFAAILAAVTLLRPALGAGAKAGRVSAGASGFGSSGVLARPGLGVFACALDGLGEAGS